VATFDPRRRGDRGPLALEVIEGTSPHRAAEGSLQVVFDGWLYNREELAGNGAARGDADDGRLILDAYRKLGEGVVPRIKGRFALLIWDGSKGELLVARDPLGTYPLFHARKGDATVLSTGIGELLADGRVSRTLNRLVLAEHLACRWPSMEDTYYEAVHRVPPGHVVILAGPARRQYRYWDPVPEDLRSAGWIEGDELDSFESVFDQAVGRCLEPGPAGIFLSGGLDSVSVAAVAADLARTDGTEPPVALSLAFPHPDADEQEIQRGVASQLGLAQVMLPYDEAVGPAGRIGSIVEANASRPVPVLGLWEGGYWRLGSVGGERGCKVILTGSGGDEMLVPSQLLAADLIGRFDLVGFWRFFAEMRRSYPWTTSELARETVWGCGVKPLMVRRGRRVLEAVAPSVLRRRWRRQIAEGTPSWVRPERELGEELIGRALGQVDEMQYRSSSFYCDDCRASLDYVTVSMELERTFEDGRKAGLPIHEPYWDADLQDFLYRIRPEMLQQGGRTKGLVRQMLTRRFPELGFERQRKVIADSFASDIFVNEIPKALREMGGAQALVELGIVDKRRLDEAITRFATDPSERSRSFLLWHVLSLESWARAHL
jgi:asparagine synthetase B (glutamine-hydrolysing)